MFSSLLSLSFRMFSSNSPSMPSQPGLLSSPSSSNSSFSTSQSKYDVFLSFHGEDTRFSFTGHLHYTLNRNGINTYKDDIDLRKGEKISDALSKAIEEAKIAIVIFSENYALSKWCLDELVKILECKISKQQKVYPVFYKVEPSTVRHQRGSFEKALAKHQDKFKLQIKWKSALKQAADLSGFHLQINEYEHEFIKKIVQEVSKSLPNCFARHVAEYPVGIQSHVDYVINNLLCIEENDTRMIGIYGRGGIGKTTIANEVYNLIAKKFEGCCFLADVRESSKQNQGLGQLQQKILSSILPYPPKVDDPNQGMELIKNRLCRQKILLIIDDANHPVQLQKLCGRCDWFGSGSRIIITTRDEGLLSKCGVSLNYKMEEMKGNEARQLFIHHAFKSTDKPINDFEDLIKDALEYAGGLPLALKVVGSNLNREDRNFWKSKLEMYKRIPDKNIIDILKVSYDDGLDDYTKKIFLDIACFFKGDDRKYVTKILEGCGFYPDVGIKVLNDKCLITIDGGGRLGMHDLVQDMGREIIRQKSSNKPGKRSRLYFHEDVREVLEKNKGTEQIEGILIDIHWDGRKLTLGPEVFAKMERLRILIIKSVDMIVCDGLNYLSNELRVLHWPNCSLEFFPSSFRGEKLVVLNMSMSSNIREMGVTLQSKNIKSINLSYCKYLTKISDLSSCSNLESLSLAGCTSLVEVDDSVGFLNRLVKLNFNHCSSLKKLPRSFKLTSLQLLLLHGCTSLEYFPEIECVMKSFTNIVIESTVIQELPSSITNLTGLKCIHMTNCKGLVRLPIDIFQLEYPPNVFVRSCPNFVNLGKEVGHNESEFNFTPSMASLKLSGSAIFSLLPCFEQLGEMSQLYLKSCKELKETLYLPPNIKNVDAGGCSSLKNFLPESSNLSQSSNFLFSLKKLELSDIAIVSLPPCIKQFVGLSTLTLRNCKQLEKILHLPPNIEHISASGLSSLKNFLPESNNLSRADNLEMLSLYDCAIVSLSPYIKEFPRLRQLYLNHCKQLEEILHLPPNIEWVEAKGCGLLERFPHASTKSFFGTHALKRLERIDLSHSNKVEVDVGNHAPDPLLIQEHFREKESNAQVYGGSSTIIYPGSRIPEWFEYRNETTSPIVSIEIDHNASMCGHQIVALVLCYVARLLSKKLTIITISLNGQQIGDNNIMPLEIMPLETSMDSHLVCQEYIDANSFVYVDDMSRSLDTAPNSINQILSRIYREGNNNMRFTFESITKNAIFKSVGVHLIKQPIQLS